MLKYAIIDKQAPHTFVVTAECTQCDYSLTSNQVQHSGAISSTLLDVAEIIVCSGDGVAMSQVFADSCETDRHI